MTREIPKYRKFNEKPYLYHSFATNKHEAMMRRDQYVERGYLVRLIQSHDRWYRIYIRDPEHGTNITYDKMAMPVYLK